MLNFSVRKSTSESRVIMRRLLIPWSSSIKQKSKVWTIKSSPSHRQPRCKLTCWVQKRYNWNSHRPRSEDSWQSSTNIRGKVNMPQDSHIWIELRSNSEWMLQSIEPILTSLTISSNIKDGWNRRRRRFWETGIAKRKSSRRKQFRWLRLKSKNKARSWDLSLNLWRWIGSNQKNILIWRSWE